MTRPRFVTALFFLAYAVAVTWPVMTLANRVEPLVLGLPFNMVWVAGWIAASGLVLWGLDRAEGRARERSAGAPEGAPRADPPADDPDRGG